MIESLYRTIVATGLICLGTAAAAHAQPTATAPEIYGITSWGDMMWVYGPGTYPSMETPELLEKMIEHWKGRGHTGVMLRTDLGQIEPFIRRNPIPDDAEMANSSGVANPRVASLLHYVDVVMESFDVHQVGAELAEKYDFEWWAWHPQVYSDGAPETVGGPGLGRIWPWSYVNKYQFENQDVITIDRQGAKLWMVPEYGYPGLREAKVNEIVHMAQTFGLRRFVLCMRSEVNQLIDPPSHADQYGFNDVVVRDMRRLYDVDIMTDPRFDVKSPKFNSNDEMVDKWRDLRGSYVTQFYREVRQALKKIDPDIKIGVTLSGDHVGPPLGNWRLDWRTWVDEGLVDEIITPVFFEGTLDHDAGKKHYLTNVRESIGVVDHQTLRNHINQSQHPGIKVITSGGPPYVFQSPPPGSDGWRCDLWYSAYTLAWYQRWWEHWMRDLDDQGYIVFFSQNFDDFPIGYSGRARGWGDGRYDPRTRSCPGVWYMLGDGSESDPRPHAVEDVVHGEGGRAMKLTRAHNGQSNLTAWHNSNPDRSNMTNGLDTSITNGITEFVFWVYRPDKEGGISAYLQDTGAEMDVGLNVAPGTGKVSYSTGRLADHGQWVATDHVVPVGRWSRLAMRVDLDRANYSTFAGDNGEIVLGQDIPIEKPKNRFVMQNGVNIPIEVQTFKQFRVALFVPEGPVGSSSYLDDVSVHWTPTLHYTRLGSHVVFEDDFEAQQLDAEIHRKQGQAGGRWIGQGAAAKKGQWTITNDTSFGQGVMSLMTYGDGRLNPRLQPHSLTLKPDTIITIDLDLFIRSNAAYASMIPDPKTRSDQRVTIGLERIHDHAVLAAAKAGDARWQLWEQTDWLDSTTGIAYDVWNHFQITIDPAAGTFRAVVQPLGEVPIPIGAGKLNSDIEFAQDLQMFIETSQTGKLVCLFDNVRITTGARLNRDPDSTPTKDE